MDDNIENSFNIILKMINIINKENKYSLNYLYNEYYEKKLIYKIIMKKEEEIIINKTQKIYADENDDIFCIFLNNNKYECYQNNNLKYILNSLEHVKYNNTEYNELSVIIPLSLLNQTYHSLINFDYILNIFLNSKLNINVCISHTENSNNTFLDKLIIENKINYIFVKNPYNFNLGFNRNMWKYLHNSKKIMFTDIDIPLSDTVIKEVIDYTKTYNIVKPYNKKLLHLSEEEKYLFINNTEILNTPPRCLFTITGGITAFDKNVLLMTGGFFEFNNYGFEDRCMDVIVLYKKYTVKKIDNTLVHLYHPKSIKNQLKHFTNSLIYMKKNYKCFYDSDNKPVDNIHEKCNHVTNTIIYDIFYNKNYNYDINLFKKEVNVNAIDLKYKNKKILFFTDHRGENAQFQNFLGNIKNYFLNYNVDAEFIINPFKYTTTIDFIYCVEQKVIDIKNYDFVFLYVGEIEYVPKTKSEINNIISGRNDYIYFKDLLSKEKKINNNKKYIFNKYFGEDYIKVNLSKNKSLVSLEINEKIIIPKLQQLKNKLIYINTNNYEDSEGQFLQTKNKFKNYIDIVDIENNDNVHEKNKVILLEDKLKCLYTSIVNLVEEKL